MMNEKLMDIVCCPLTHQPLRKAGKPLLGTLNQQIEAGTLTNVAGGRIAEPLREALVTADGKRVYLIVDGLVSLLVSESVLLEDVA